MIMIMKNDLVLEKIRNKLKEFMEAVLFSSMLFDSITMENTKNKSIFKIKLKEDKHGKGN